jgi:DMSO/TMAO reductase YedYZ molybdopterin-dependent catalytic subunit
MGIKVMTDTQSPLITPGDPRWPGDARNSRSPGSGWQPPSRPEEAERPIRFGRAAFLGLLGVGAGGLLLGQKIGPAFNVTSTLTASILPQDGFRIYTVTDGYPQIKAATYRLRVDGLVHNPSTFSLADILAMPYIHEVRTYQCVTGWIVNNVHWQGISLRHLISLVRPTSAARYISFYSADGAYTESLSMEQALKPDVLLGYKLNEKPLAVEQGYPLRLVVPGMYGYKFAKWVNRVSFSATQLQGYWEQNGYAADAYDKDIPS